VKEKPAIEEIPLDEEPHPEAEPEEGHWDSPEVDEQRHNERTEREDAESLSRGY